MSIIILILVMMINFTRGIDFAGEIILPSDQDLIRENLVILNDNQFTAILTKKGKFQFYDIPDGSYLLKIEDPFHEFERIRIEINSTSINYYTANLFNNWDELGEKLEFLKIKSIRSKSYFKPREGFNLLGILTSPMIMMSLFSVGTIFLLPMLMKSIDPDELREMQRQQLNNQVQVPDLSKRIASMFSADEPTTASSSNNH